MLLMNSPNSARRNLSPVPVAIAVAAVATLGVSAYKDFTKPDRVIGSGKEIAANIEKRLKPGKQLPVAAAILAVDAGVNYRSTPVKVNTANNAWITGNKVSEGGSLLSDADKLEKPTILVRPIMVENKERFTKDDPRYWFGGLVNNKVVWIGLNEETRDKIHVYSRLQDQDNTGEKSLKSSITVQGVDSDYGVSFDAGGYTAAAAEIMSSTGENDPYLTAIQQNLGFREVEVLGDK